MPRTILAAALVCVLAARTAPAQEPQTKPAARKAFSETQIATRRDHEKMMELLGIEKLRPGANGGNREAPNAANYDESKASPYPNLPDPLVLKDGEKVTTAEAWWNRRRPEIVEDFDREVYGRVPGDTPRVNWEVTATTAERNGNVPVVVKKLVGHVDNSSCPEIAVGIQLTLTTPADAQGPVPVMMEFGFGGFGPRPGGSAAKGGPDPGKAARPGGGGPTWQQQVLARGWGYAILVPGSIQADNGAGLTRGIIGLCNKGRARKADDWGALRAWAWGASRALDYFETVRAVDARQVGIEGHSRYGKAALVTMAYDPRFAIAYVSSSGEGGAKLHRRNWGELVENVAGAGEYHWMAGNFLKYAGPLNWNDLPVDSHELVALCAPRPVFIGAGATNGDGWVDAKGMFLAAAGAGPVYRILDKKDLGTADFPPIETTLTEGDVAFRQHGGGHTPGPNWPTFLAFAGRYINEPKPLASSTQSTRESAGGTRPIPAIGERVRPFVDNKEVSGVVTLVATPDRIVQLDATGKADIAADRPLRPDSIFWIASMTKPITATAVLMLQDEGRLSVDDPIEKHLPEFKGLKDADGKPVRVTIRHLLTHTSGMAEISAAEARDIKDLAGVIPLYVAKPVKFEPGSKWTYCQSGINTAARIVEVVSGVPFDRFLEQRLFAPLGMKDTTFYLAEEQLPRLATSYRRTDKGELSPTPVGILYGKAPTSRDRFPAANGGLFSTAADYSRFCRMILNGGELDGRRYVKPESVELMTSVQTGDLKTGFSPGNGWGLGWCVVREPQGVTAMLSPGTFGHGGAYGTQAWIDPVKKRAYILMVQRADFPNSDQSEVRRAFQDAANSALADDAPFKLNLRSRNKDQGKLSVVEVPASWAPRKTAIIVCDMWDDHWCKSAARRVSELAGPMNETLRKARERGTLIIHAPSTCTAFYKDTPQRLRAQQAPYSPTPTLLVTTPRWGTAWYWTDAKREGVLPIDDSDMGCDCEKKCEIGAPWTRQVAAIEIAEADAITDDGQEVWNLLAGRGIDNVILCGVHLNMCVLGRPFAIRQMSALGKKVALIRDLTDTMYNPERPPGVSHFAGTDLMVEHVEIYWCPTFTSADITGSPSFRFKGDTRVSH